MKNLFKKFIVAKRNFSQNSVEKGDVGLVNLEKDGKALIFFIRIGKQIKLNDRDFEFINVKKTGDAFPKKICNVCHKLKKNLRFCQKPECERRQIR